jgi:adenine-specific DNA-methyltransferase
MTKEEKFYEALQNVFIGAKIEGEGGFINLMRIKSTYYSQIEKLLKEDIEKALEKYPTFRDELFNKLYDFFSRYFSESGSIYFNSTPFHNNVYEKVYTDERDVILFWKTHMLYYVKTDMIFRSMPVEFDGLKFYFDASKIENKKANEKRDINFVVGSIQEDKTIVFKVIYSEKGTKTKQEDILKELKKEGIAITEEQLEKAFRVFEKQSEVDFFINKNAKGFLQEQFKLWSYQYFWEGAKEWSADRVNELQILRDIAFKIIDFISQFEDELVKIWNKPKFVKNSNYVITLDRIADKKLVEKIKKHKNYPQQVKEWEELGIDKDNPRAPIDTKYFKDLELEILSQFEDLDKSLDGWLIKSENYQALNTILPKFKEKVQTIYIDPPFNTNSSPIIYLNKYKDSSWLTMMENRLSISKCFLKDGGINVTAIDDVELRYLTTLLDDVFEKDNYITTITSEANPQGRVANKVSQTSEYHIIHAKDLSTIGKLFVKKLESRKPSSLKRTGTNSRREERPNRYYPILLKGGKIFMISSEEYKKIYDSKTSTFDDNFVNNLKEKYTKAGYDFILPIGENGERLVWQRTFERVLAEKDTYIVKNGSIFTPAFDIEIPKTLWKHPLYSNPEYGSEYLTNMLGSSKFETPKSYHTIMQFLVMAGGEGIYLDYFGGSGTTAQAVLELNKLDEEDGRRKYLIVEMGEYFYSVLLPRLKKLCISSKWKNAKPQDSNGMSQFFKYYELEQYEEALANCKYEDSDLFTASGRNPYQEYVFMKDEKMLKALEVDYKNNKVKVDLSKLYADIDIVETLSNLTGKWIKKISDGEVEFMDGTKVNTKDLDYKLIKPLIWWG